MISKEEMKAEWEQAMGNRRLLDRCPRHRFIGQDRNTNFLRRSCTCSNCGGKMYLVQISQYIRGYESAGGSAEDIWPGWGTEAQRSPTQHGIYHKALTLAVALLAREHIADRRFTDDKLHVLMLVASGQASADHIATIDALLAELEKKDEV